jgi:hypothetical protein
VNRWILRGSCFVALLLSAQVMLAQEFSADVFSTKDSGELKKVYAGKNKVRFEVNAKTQGMGAAAVIFDESQSKYTVLMTDRHMYMDAPPTMVNKMIANFWRVEDVDSACAEWRKTAAAAGADQNWGSCTKVGGDTVDGRAAVKYEGVSKKGEKMHVWVDTKLRRVVKTDESSGGFELRNIQEGSQPASLFEVPASYTKFDMGSMQRPH